MSEFYKRFLTYEGRTSTPDNSRFVALGAFGKHPGWDDHVEDIGLETDSLILAKRVLYVQGVGGRIDTGAWEKLKEEQRLPEFNHAFIWARDKQMLVGRMWSSSDGKGRTRYPMIICAHCIGASIQWALESVLPQLEQIETECKATKSAEDVRAILTRGRTTLRGMIESAPTGSSPLGPTQLHQFVSAEAFGPSRIGWFRLLYWMQSQAQGFAAGKFNQKGDLSGLRPHQARLPVAGMSGTSAAVQAWADFFSSFADPLAPVLFMWPLGGRWIDVTLGEPTSEEFFNLRAAQGVIPLATEIPYDFDQSFREHAARQLEDFENGRPIRQNGASAEVPGEQKQTGFISATQRWFKNLGGKSGIFLLCLVAAAVAAIFIYQHRSGNGVTVANKSGSPVSIQNESQRAPPPAAPVFSAPTQTSSQSSNVPVRSEDTGRVSSPTVSQIQPQKSAVNEKQPIATTLSPTADAQAKPSAAPSAKEATLSNPPSAPIQAVAVATRPVTDAGKDAVAMVRPAVAVVSSPGASDSPEGTKSLTNGIGMVLVWVAGLPGSGNGGWVGKYEVTQAEYRQLAQPVPGSVSNPAQPVGDVSWAEAADFCRKLTTSEKAGDRLPNGFAYTLPTLQQWDFFVGDSSFETAVTSRDMSSPRSAPERVGSFPPNRYGLCDVLGNVWEWCVDPDAQAQKPLRGGGYDNGLTYQFKPLEPATVRRSTDGAKSPDAGFRCVLVRQP